MPTTNVPTLDTLHFTQTKISFISPQIKSLFTWDQTKIAKHFLRGCAAFI